MLTPAEAEALRFCAADYGSLSEQAEAALEALLALGLVDEAGLITNDGRYALAVFDAATRSEDQIEHGRRKPRWVAHPKESDVPAAMCRI